MNRQNSSWIIIATFGSVLVHGLAYGWLLTTESDGHGVAQGVQVTLSVVYGDVSDGEHSISEPANMIEKTVTASADLSVSERVPLNTESIGLSDADATIVATAAPAKFVTTIKAAQPEVVTAASIGLEQSVPLVESNADLAEQTHDISNQQEAVLAKADLQGEDKITVSGAVNQNDNDIASPAFALGSNSNPKPKYPYIAQKRGWQGDVLLGVDVKQDGWPQRVTILESSGFGLLDNAAVATIRDYWQFKPALRFRKPVEGYTQVPISFRLN